MVHCQNRVSVISIVTDECNILLLLSYGFKVCAVSFFFKSSCLIVYIHLRHINKQRRTTTPFSLWYPLSQLSLLCWYYKNTVLRFVWYRLVFIQLIIEFISIYPASTNSDVQHHHSTSLMSYHLATAEYLDCDRGQTIFVREIVTPI